MQRHAGEGETIAEAIRDCLDYGKNPEKTESVKYISAYECDPATVADEFLLAKASYAKTRPVFEQYKAAKYSRKFLAEHEADIELYRAAQAEMRRLLGGAKLPKMDALKEEGRKLTAKKKRLYGEYQKARRDMQEIVTIKANIDTLLGYTEPGRKQEKER